MNLVTGKHQYLLIGNANTILKLVGTTRLRHLTHGQPLFWLLLIQLKYCFIFNFSPVVMSSQYRPSGRMALFQSTILLT